MAKQAKVNWNSFTKQQLIDMVKRLTERIAELERSSDATPDAFPWGQKTGTMLPNPFLKE